MILLRLALMTLSTSSSQSSTFPVGYRVSHRGTSSPSALYIRVMARSSSNLNCIEEEWEVCFYIHVHVCTCTCMYLSLIYEGLRTRVV